MTKLRKLIESLGNFGNRHDMQIWKRDVLAEIDKWEKALEFYADSEGYALQNLQKDYGQVIFDAGKRAREALRPMSLLHKMQCATCKEHLGYVSKDLGDGVWVYCHVCVRLEMAWD